jgi:AGZA family xanthine/uracil permease-like MFS transporter
MSFKSAAAFRLPLWRAGEVNAMSGLFINLLVNVVTITVLASGVVNIPSGKVTGTILPALGVELVVGNIFYFTLAKRLSRKEKRDDVAAMPYGPSVPHMFIVTLVIMLPTYLKTHDAIKAWEAGLAWAFIIGLIILAGAFIGPAVRRLTPRAALLGMLAGISITFISMRPAAQMFEATWIALPVLAVIIVGFVAGVRLPGNFPIGLAALLLGSAIGWIGGYMHTADVSAAAKDIAVGLPSLNLDLLGHGLNAISPLLATAIPLGVYNFCEAMSNVESAAAAGDSYNLRHVLLADGTGAVVGAALGSPFPPAVYIGQPGWKEAGGRLTYSLASGSLIFVLCVAGLFPLLASVLPIPAIVPVLLYIGLVIGSQAFRVVPRAHYAAIVLAMVPNLASWASGYVDDALQAAGTSAAQVGQVKLANSGVIYDGLHVLGSGATLAGMVLGGIAVFLIDRRFLQATLFCLAGAGLCIVGLIHGDKVHVFTHPKIALGYGLMGVVCLALYALRIPERVPDPADPADLEAAREQGWRPGPRARRGPLVGGPVPAEEPVIA